MTHLSREFLAGLTPTHWLPAGQESLVAVRDMEPTHLENAYAMCVKWGMEYREDYYYELCLAEMRGEAQEGASDAALQLSAMQLCRDRIACFAEMERVIAERVLKRENGGGDG